MQQVLKAMLCLYMSRALKTDVPTDDALIQSKRQECVSTLLLPRKSSLIDGKKVFKFPFKKSSF